MSAYQLRLVESQGISDEEHKRLESQLADEIDACTEVAAGDRKRVKHFMVDNAIWSLEDVTYETRCSYEAYLKTQLAEGSIKTYLREFDKIKLQFIERQAQTLVGREKAYRYQNQKLFLLYHPDPEIAKSFMRTRDKANLVWDFGKNAPEILKKQIFKILHILLKQDDRIDRRKVKLDALKEFYNFCVESDITDIEYLEMGQVQAFHKRLKAIGETTFESSASILDMSMKILFMGADEINWKANVWYLERFHFERARVNPANPIASISFLEIQQKRNRELMQRYMKYCLGVTSLSISVIQIEASILRRFLVKMQEYTDKDICSVTTVDIEKYFSYLEQKDIQPETYNKEIISILHFFDYLKAQGLIDSVPFHEQYYLKKTILKHHDRSVAHQVFIEIMQKLDRFPEDSRLMFLHQWAIGLRASEVCTLKGDAYYLQGGEPWIQVYQIKMKNYKCIPIPVALYQLMKIYINKYQITPEEYIFKNTKGGAYCYSTYKLRMQKYCKKNLIGNSEYLFQSHDYRHTLATFFYDQGVSIQGIRDYLGHAYEEMTEQYIDFMPRKIRKANEEYFKDEQNSLAKNLKKRGKYGK